MKILFDLISIQGFINGGAEYTRRILYELIDRNPNSSIIEIIGLYDSTIPFVENYCILSFLTEKKIRIVDIKQSKSLSEIIVKNNIDCLFIGIAQRYSHYNITNLNCKTIVVIHDVYDYEINDNYLNLFLRIRYGSNLDKLKALMQIFINKIFTIKDYSNLIHLIKQQECLFNYSL